MPLEQDVIGESIEIKPEEFVGRGGTIGETLSDVESQIARAYRRTGYEPISIKPKFVTKKDDEFYILYSVSLIKHTLIRKKPVQIVTTFPSVPYKK